MKYESRRIRSSSENVARSLDDYIVENLGSGIKKLLEPKNPDITKAYIPKEVIIIGAHAFDGCRNLRELEFLGREVSVDNYAFANTPNLKKITKNHISVVHEGAFENSGITEFIAPVKWIYKDAFKNCPSLTRIISTFKGPRMLLKTSALVNLPNLELLECASPLKLSPDAISNCPNLNIDAEIDDRSDDDFYGKNRSDSPKKPRVKGSGKVTGPIANGWDLLPEAEDIENITVLDKAPEIDVNVGDYLAIDSDSELFNDDNAVEIKRIHEKSLVEVEFDFGEEEYLGVIATVDVYRLGRLGEEEDELIKRGVKLFLLQTQDSGGQSAGTYAIARWR
jgi:hypothetical protein